MVAPRSITAVVAASFLGALSACGEGRYGRAPGEPETSLPCDVRPTALRIEPSRAQIEVGPDVRTELRFRALADTDVANGGPSEVGAEWSLDRPEIGVVDATGLLMASGGAGGTAELMARARGLEARATVGLVWVDARFVGVDVGARRLFDAGHPRNTTTRSPRLLAPGDGTWFPSESGAAEFRWDRAGHPIARLRLANEAADVSIFTDTDRYVVDGAVWRGLADSSRGHTLRVTLEASDGEGIVYRDRNAIHVGFCQGDERCDGTDDDCDGTPDADCAAAVSEGPMGQDDCEGGK